MFPLTLHARATQLHISQMVLEEASMKRLILTIVFVGIAATVPSGAFAADDLSQATRARIENVLVRELGPRVGVFDYLSFKVDGNGTVTLYGQVRDAMLKKHAAEDAKKVEGIKRVQNEIEVLPLSPTDDEIRRAVYVAIYSQNGFERYRTRAVPPVHIIVRNSSVLLTGVVNSEVERRQAENIVRGISGIIGVQNTLRVEK
jgi:hyperosmotically inducible periplasmic protein